jgi:hypothetical protein
MNLRIWRPVGWPHVIFEEQHEGGVVRQGLEVFLLVNLKPQLLRHGMGGDQTEITVLRQGNVPSLRIYFVTLNSFSSSMSKSNYVRVSIVSSTSLTLFLNLYKQWQRHGNVMELYLVSDSENKPVISVTEVFSLLSWINSDDVTELSWNYALWHPKKIGNDFTEVFLLINLHCKKELAVFPSLAGKSLIKLFLGGNNLVFFRPEKVWGRENG